MKKLLLGNEAVARGAWEAGCVVDSAYPGTPSTEITEFISKYDDIYCEWAPNEKVALEVAIGASFAGGRAMSTMKHVGLNVAADPLFTASYTGVNGGLVVMVADDPGMHSSQNEQDTRMLARASKICCLEPADSQECKDFTKKAFEISEQFDTPVILRLTTRVAHSQSLVELEDRQVLEAKPFEKDINKYVMMPAMARGRHVVVEERELKLKAFAEDTDLNRIEKSEEKINGKRVGVITSGISYQYSKEALGEAVSYLKLGMVNPLPVKLIEEFAASVDEIYVIEELEPVFEEYVKKLGIKVIGKEAFSLLGEYTARMIKKAVLGEEACAESLVKEQIPVRPPVMCPGCPHRGMYYVLKKLGLRVSGDIGCYTLGALAPMNSMDACVCMGASIGMAHGFEKVRGDELARNTVAVIGDSTFIHSGITGLINVVYNKGTSTVIILDNSITGMTGHQQNPATGYTIRNEETKAVDLVKLAQAIGVERIRVCDPFDVENFEKVVKEEVATSEPSVIISQRPCALLKSVKFEGALEICQGDCKKCKMCMKLGCPAIVLKGDRIEIDQSLCVGCGLCTKLCKFGAIRKAGSANE